MGNRIYGCDDCLAVCPWNKFAQAGREAKLAAREDLRAPPLAELARLDDAGIPRAVRQIAGQAHRPRPVRAQRADRDRQFRRCRRSRVEAERLLDDASPLVRGAAVWALSQLLPPDRVRGAGSIVASTANSMRAFCRSGDCSRSWRPHLSRHGRA